MSIRFTGQVFTTDTGQTLDLASAAAFSDTARAHGIDNTVPQDLLEQNVPRAVALLTAIYAKLGCRAEVTSFYRCPTLNLAVGGKVNPPSAHMSGRAIDSVPLGVPIHEAFDILKELGDELQFDQLIIERDHHGNIWLHSAVALDGKAPRKMAFALDKSTAPTRVARG